MAISLLPLTLKSQDLGFWGYDNDEMGFNGILWKTGLSSFEESTYAGQVHRLLRKFEETTGRNLQPGTTGKAALKIYTNSGSGLATPPTMVRAVVSYLLEKGFTRDDLCIVDAREANLRDTGYLPPLSRMYLTGPYFDGVRVYSLDSGDLRSETWFYESPLPQEFTSPMGRVLLHRPIELDPQEARKSYLPANLLTEVDFWINLPVAAHHPATGLSGALVNASLWNISNGTRFFNSPANAPVAVAEISSIPELRARWALNLISLEAYQYIAGPGFNANYTSSLPEIWMSVDPVIMDANLIQLLNRSRKQSGFIEFPPVPEFIEYSAELGLGNPLYVETQVIRLED